MVLLVSQFTVILVGQSAISGQKESVSKQLAIIELTKLLKSVRS